MPQPVTIAEARGNRLLAALRDEALARLVGHLEPWSAATGQILHEPGEDVSLVYFPLDGALVSFVVLLEDGGTVETALVGREGMVGGVASRGYLPAFTRAQVQAGGAMLRISARDVQAAKEQAPEIGNLFSRYADCLVAQLFQLVACAAAHSIEQRTARWLEAAMELTGRTEFLLTQDQFAGMLGVGRSYLSRVVQAMKEGGILETGRGSIRVRDPARLGSLACGCQDAVRRHFATVLKGVYPPTEEAGANDGIRPQRPGSPARSWT